MGNRSNSRIGSMKDVLRKPNKGVENCLGTNGILSRIFRKILLDLDVTGSVWDSLMNDYIRQAYKNINKDNIRDYTSIRGNLNKELSRMNMTWKVFCNKALRFLKIKRFKIVFIFEHENGKLYQISEVVDLPTAFEEEKEREQMVRDYHLDTSNKLDDVVADTSFNSVSGLIQEVANGISELEKGQQK